MNSLNVHYLVCATQRSGSTLVCELLAQTEVAGIPNEFLLLWLRERRRTGEVFWLEALQKTIDMGRTPNGVFGCKVMANYFPTAMDLLRAVPAAEGLTTWQIAERAFDRPKVVRVRRRDRVRQAISGYIASATGIYHMARRAGSRDPFLGGALANRDPEHNRAVPFDYQRIRARVDGLERDEGYWDRMFEESGVHPFEIVYEDFVVDRDATIARVLAFLGIAYEPSSTPLDEHVAKLSNEVNERFYDAFQQEARTRGDAK